MSSAWIWYLLPKLSTNIIIYWTLYYYLLSLLLLLLHINIKHIAHFSTVAIYVYTMCNMFCNVLVLNSGILNDNDHCNIDKQTFSSRALWCSKRDLSAFNTSTSLDTPDGDEACRLTTVIRSDRSWRATRHSRCSSSNCSNSNVSHQLWYSTF